ncbi:MAG: hypothetical protein J6K72_02270 [Clostridia bacterium]|nr:hypothetical protein [Clostridia bacterium]
MMQTQRQQLVPTDLHPHALPPEKEIHHPQAVAGAVLRNHEGGTCHE